MNSTLQGTRPNYTRQTEVSIWQVAAPPSLCSKNAARLPRTGLVNATTLSAPHYKVKQPLQADGHAGPSHGLRPTQTHALHPQARAQDKVAFCAVFTYAAFVCQPRFQHNALAVCLHQVESTRRPPCKQSPHVWKQEALLRELFQNSKSIKAPKRVLRYCAAERPRQPAATWAVHLHTCK